MIANALLNFFAKKLLESCAEKGRQTDRHTLCFCNSILASSQVPLRPSRSFVDLHPHFLLFTNLGRLLFHFVVYRKLSCQLPSRLLLRKLTSWITYDQWSFQSSGGKILLLLLLRRIIQLEFLAVRLCHPQPFGWLKKACNRLRSHFSSLLRPLLLHSLWWKENPTIPRLWDNLSLNPQFCFPFSSSLWLKENPTIPKLWDTLSHHPHFYFFSSSSSSHTLVQFPETQNY